MTRNTDSLALDQNAISVEVVFTGAEVALLEHARGEMGEFFWAVVIRQLALQAASEIGTK